MKEQPEFMAENSEHTGGFSERVLDENALNQPETIEPLIQNFVQDHLIDLSEKADMEMIEEESGTDNFQFLASQVKSLYTKYDILGTKSLDKLEC
jgi:hypothetical protein